MNRYVLGIVEGSDSGREVALDEALEIGREPTADLALVDDSLVSRSHARVTPRPDGVLLEDLGSSNGTVLNGQRITDPVLAQPGDRILVGSTTLELREIRPPEYLLAILSQPGVQVRLGGVLEIGRDPAADVALVDDPLISQRHARLVPGHDGVIVEDLRSSNGTFVGGLLVTEPTLVRPGDQVRLGDTTIEVREMPKPTYAITIVSEHGVSEEVRLSEPLEIGRDAAAGLSLVEDLLVSNRHARLTPGPDGVILEDLDSRNGTFVNGARVTGSRLVKPGDRILVGATELELQTVEPSAKPTLVRPPEPATRASTDMSPPTEPGQGHPAPGATVIEPQRERASPEESAPPFASD